MNLINENLYESKVDVKCFTSNGVVKNNSELVMGTGTARLVKSQYPELPKTFGIMITSTYTKVNGVYKYGLLVDPLTKVAALQTKYHYKDSSDIKLIQYSLNKLRLIAEQNSTILFGIPIPGIGFGNLDRDTVMYLLEGLPYNVLIFDYS